MAIVTHPANDAYRDGWDATFGKTGVECRAPVRWTATSIVSTTMQTARAPRRVRRAKGQGEHLQKSRRREPHLPRSRLHDRGPPAHVLLSCALVRDS